jgi:hypothetical protein
MVGLLDYVQSSPSICGWIQSREMLLTSQGLVDQTRRKSILDWKQGRVDVDVDVVESFSKVMQARVLYWLETKFVEKGRYVEVSCGYRQALRQPAKRPKGKSSRRMTSILKCTLRSHDRSGGLTCYLYFAMGAILGLAV